MEEKTRFSIADHITLKVAITIFLGFVSWVNDDWKVIANLIEKDEAFLLSLLLIFGVIAYVAFLSMFCSFLNFIFKKASSFYHRDEEEWQMWVSENKKV